MRSKALAGATQGGADGRTSVDQLGTILTWMQERGGESFLFVTANDVTGLPELLRKGRFDEIFFVDLPNEEEQPKILQAALAANGRAQHAIGLGAGSAGASNSPAQRSPQSSRKRCSPPSPMAAGRSPPRT